MSTELRDSLVYDCNYNLFIVKTMLPNIRNIQDRQTTVRWLRYLKTGANTIDEMKLRNDFMYYLVLNVQEGVLKPPFDKPPLPGSSIMSMANLLPGVSEGGVCDMNPPKTIKSGDSVNAGGAQRSEIMRRSPDGGAFLASQPIPDVGAFCYLSVITKKPK
ncbi:uncharacterized protein LOC124406583 [Diprion similis]|uniref:uncharacterized protein LOC124406583 n=1 Tax=Diprion similis TaxID=362088 RepID=UPI001EF88A95|nr:uncharacterized protein LOC124406583 [Diprion similis]